MAQTKEQWEVWYAKNGDAMRARSKEWYSANRERARRKQKRYRVANPDKIKAARVKWVTANPEKKLLASVRNRAKRNGWVCELTVADIVCPSICPVLGIPIIRGGPLDNRPSIDRIDNTKGYVRGNIVVVSWRANRLKSDANHDELVLLAAFYGPKAVTACPSLSAAPAT